MKTQIKQSFYHLFIDGKANSVEVARVFGIIGGPALIAVLVYMAIHHFCN